MDRCRNRSHCGGRLHRWGSEAIVVTKISKGEVAVTIFAICFVLAVSFTSGATQASLTWLGAGLAALVLCKYLSDQWRSRQRGGPENDSAGGLP